MKSLDHPLPVVTLACGIPNGKGVSHGVALDVVVVDGGCIVGPAGLIVGPNKARWRMAGCRQHGNFIVAEGQILFASREARVKGRKAVIEMTERVPVRLTH